MLLKGLSCGVLKACALLVVVSDYRLIETFISYSPAWRGLLFMVSADAFMTRLLLTYKCLLRKRMRKCFSISLRAGLSRSCVDKYILTKAFERFLSVCILSKRQSLTLSASFSDVLSYSAINLAMAKPLCDVMGFLWFGIIASKLS